MDIMLERILMLIPKKDDGKFKHGALKEFANSIGLKSGNLISDWINGRSQSYENYLYQIAVKYDVSVEWLKGETDEKTPTPVSESGLSESEAALIELFRRIPQEQRAAMVQAIEITLRSQGLL